MRAKFQANIFVFCCQYLYFSSQYLYFLLCNGVKNRVMVMASLFWNSIFGTSNCRTTKQITFFNHETKLDKIAMFLKGNVDF